jgi:myo-inositol catabolism protein IolC
MSLGHDGNLFLLAFDHRASLAQSMFGFVGRRPAPAEQERMREAKWLVWEGFGAALAAGAPAAAAGVLVDEDTGAAAARAARAAGILLALAVEESGRHPFEFEYGDDFDAHLEAFDPAFGKALVRWNPADDPATKVVQAERLLRLCGRLRQQKRKLLFELIVPPTPHQLALASGRLPDFDAHLRPGLMLEAIYEIQEAGIEPDVWKVEGLDAAADCALVSALLRRDGRDRVKAVVLGRGADDARVEHWVRTAAAVPGYAGFAIGRTIWWDAVQNWKEGRLDRAEAAAAIGAAYRRFIDAYEGH